MTEHTKMSKSHKLTLGGALIAAIPAFAGAIHNYLEKEKLKSELAVESVMSSDTSETITEMKVERAAFEAEMRTELRLLKDRVVRCEEATPAVADVELPEPPEPVQREMILSEVEPDLEGIDETAEDLFDVDFDPNGRPIRIVPRPAAVKEAAKKQAAKSRPSYDDPRVQQRLKDW